MFRALATIILALPLGCSSAKIQGADLSRGLPQGHGIASFSAEDCRDASGAPFVHVARVTLAEDDSRVPYLVESIPAYESLVVRRHYDEGGERVFWVIAKPAGGDEVLRDYRLPKEGKGDGRLGVGRRFSELPQPDGTTRARLLEAEFACRLVAKEPPPKDGGP